MSAQPLPIGAFGMSYDIANVIFLSYILSCLVGGTWFLRCNLTMINMTKGIHFCVIFLYPKSNDDRFGFIAK